MKGLRAGFGPRAGSRPTRGGGVYRCGVLLFGEVVSFGEELVPIDDEPLFGVELLPLEPVELLSLEPVVPVDPLEFVEPSDELLEPLVPVAPVVPLLSGCAGLAVSPPFAPSVLPDDPVRDPSSLVLPRAPVDGSALLLPCVLDPLVPVVPDDPLLVPLELPELPLGLCACTDGPAIASAAAALHVMSIPLSVCFIAESSLKRVSRSSAAAMPSAQRLFW